MDSGDLIYLAFFAFWLYSQIAAVAKKNKERQRRIEAQRQAGAATPQPPPTSKRLPPRQASPPPERRERPPAQAPSIGEGLLLNLTDLENEIAATLGEIDEKVRAQVAFLVDHDYKNKADGLRRELRDERSPEFARASQETQWLLSHYRGMLQTARVHSGLRQQRELRGANTIADGLAAELDQARKVAHPLPPPVAIVWDIAAGDRLLESALADATLFLPRTVVQDPSHWSLAAPEITRYLGASAPSLYQDIYQGLELGAAEAQVGNDPEALTRVLYASWIGRIVSDAVGALLFGPAYVLSIAKLYAQPKAPARVTSIVLNQDGTVHTEPPAHVRVHVSAHWLTRMGHASEAAAIRSAWDEEHGSPEVLGFWGSMTSLPAAALLETASELTDGLFQLPFDAFGKTRLAHVPGLAGWENHAREAAAARASLADGQQAQGSARALLAAAIEASLTSPGANAQIHRALLASLGKTPVSTPKRADAKKTAPPRPVSSESVFAHLTAQDVAEALILEEILVNPPSRKASAR